MFSGSKFSYGNALLAFVLAPLGLLGSVLGFAASGLLILVSWGHAVYTKLKE